MVDTDMPETKTEQKKRGRFERSVETQWLLQYLRDNAEPGKLITYEELTAACGAEVRSGGKAYNSLRSAKGILKRENGWHFVTVSAQGIRWADDQEMPDVCDGLVNRHGRAARRARATMTCFRDLNSLPAEKRYRVLAAQSVNAFIEANSKRKRREQIQAHIADENRPHELNYGEMLEALKKRENGKKQS